MESTLSHSRQPITLLPKKGGYNGGSTTTKTVCDDLIGGQTRFGAPTTLSPRVEDYTEMFGGFHVPRASSIPVLDLPVANEEANAFFDARSCSVFDYNEVFAGFDGQDFAVSHEELLKAMMREKSGGGSFCSSDEEAWTPEHAECISEESDHSATSPCFSNGDTQDLMDRTTEFNISYHKTGNEVTQNGITHVTQLLDVPGHTYMVDGTTFLPNSVHECSFLEVGDDSHISIDLSGEMTRERHVGRTGEHLANGNSCGPSSGYDSRPESVLVRSGSLLNEAFVTISDISLKTRPFHLPPPSRPPPALDVKSRDSSVLTGDSVSIDSGGTSGDGSPTYFDVQVDSSSSAAASAAAMKEAMEQAQAKLKSAKELMERKKDAFHSRSRSRSKSDSKSEEEKVFKIVDGSGRRKDERSQSILVNDNGLEHSFLAERQQVSVSTQIVPDEIQGIKPSSMSKRFTEEKQVSELLASQDSKVIHGAGEWKEDTEFFELVKTDKSEKAFDRPNNENKWVQNINIHEHGKKDNKVVTETVHQKQEKQKRVKAVRADRVFEEWVKNSYVSKETNECVESFVRSEAVKVTHGQKGLENMVQAGEEKVTHEENERKFRLDPRLVETEKKHSWPKSLEKNDNVGIESKSIVKPVVTMEKETRPIEVDKSMEDKKRFRTERKHDEEKQRLNLERANVSVELAVEQAETERRLKEALEAVEQKRMAEALEKESNEKKHKDTLEGYEHEKQMREAVEKENERKLKEVTEKGKSKRRQREAAESGDPEKRENVTIERDEHEKQLKEALEEEENEKRQKGVKQEEYEKSQREACEREESERKLKEALTLKEEKSLKDAYEGEEVEKRCRETSEKEEETGNRLEETSEQDRSGGSRWVDVGEEIEIEINIADDVEEIQEACEWQEIELKLKNDGNKQIDRKPKASGRVKALHECEVEGDELELPCSDIREFMAGDSVKDTAQANIKETKAASQVDSEMSNIRKAKDNMDGIMARRVLQESVETGRKMNATQPVLPYILGSTYKTAQQVNANQNMGRKMKDINETVTEEEKESERTRREKELEEECLRKIEEEREREREREKDRMAVDRSTLEARDRAYTDARERAERTAIERATAEARQRALNEACERLEKSCAEAREKSRADKASAEARLKAERAAVERATVEARERSFGKAMAERTVFEARERIERSISDKFSASSRSSGMRPSSSSCDLQSQSAGLLNGSRHLYSSVYNSSYLERSEGIEGESDQRCKARLERHQRTADRAAKALAEKNMRDLLTQREQAERNRLAETLDAEVKRWSSGKEGNLRALLSTLQYILGPGSGWQPIPLTEVITAAAVKKAYRKATLCVHPDKLQQRGASIQHKYICEKVFDLLKDAWNKFNSEER